MSDTSNPYQSPAVPDPHEPARYLPSSHGVRASLLKQGLLYRRIQLEAPVEAEIEFDGRGLRDVIRVNQQVIASSISWWRITPKFNFTIGTKDYGEVPVAVNLAIGSFLKIRSFEIEIAGQTVYREQAGRRPAG